MTDNPPPTDDDRDTDQPDQPQPEDSQPSRGGVSGLLRQLLETLQRLDESGRSVERGEGRRQSGKTAFEYDYSVKIGGDRSESSVSSEETDQPVSVQNTLDGASVTLDLPSVDPETLRAGVRGRRLLVAAGDELVARVTLPETGYTVQSATYNNGILEILLQQDDSEVTADD